eukprot:15325154-Ditylum_brightwellii.AAC.1
MQASSRKIHPSALNCLNCTQFQASSSSIMDWCNGYHKDNPSWCNPVQKVIYMQQTNVPRQYNKCQKQWRKWASRKKLQ